MQHPLQVTKEEAGQKLFQYLQRKLNASSQDIHKWIRTGQVRINGKRITAFERVEEEDIIRIPPFAFPEKQQAENIKEKLPFPVIYEDKELLVINKPSHLPVQNGSKQSISVASILKEHYKNAAFMPTPAHRLDKEVSGILLIGKTYKLLQDLHQCFAHKNNHTLEKYYKAWVNGEVKSTGLWKDFLATETNQLGYEKIRTSSTGVLALLEAEVIKFKDNHTLLEIKLLTGRKHQIRVQCASRNHSIVGDKKYNGEEYPELLLHSYKIIYKNQIFEVNPLWKENFSS